MTMMVPSFPNFFRHSVYNDPCISFTSFIACCGCRGYHFPIAGTVIPQRICNRHESK